MPTRPRYPAPPPLRRPPPPPEDEQEYSFDPEVPPSTPAKPHHFAINPPRERQDLDELEDDIDGATYSPEEYRDLVPFIRQQVGMLMMDWHSGQWDPVYAVASFYYDGNPYPNREIMERAEARLDNLWRAAKSRSLEKRELGVILNWLRWEMGQASMVKRNAVKSSGRGERTVLREWILGVVWDWEQADMRGERGRLRQLSAALYELALDAGCLDDIEEVDPDERGCDVAEELRRAVNSATVEDLRRYVERAAEVLGEDDGSA